jgi:bla regulator protein blaR1
VSAKLNPGKKLALGVIGVVVLAAPVVVGVMNAPSLGAQSSQAKSGATTTPKFDVATVKPVDPGSGAGGGKSGNGGGSGAPLRVDHQRVGYTSTLFNFIARAYGVQGCLPNSGASCPLLTGGPDWIKKNMFEIQAKAPDGSPDYTTGQLSAGRAPELQLMFQALLADRFSLKIHRENKDLPVFALTIAKNGPKSGLKKAAGDMIELKDGSFVKDNTIFFRSSGPNDPNVHLTVKNRPIQDFLVTLSGMMGRPVLDRTGLTGEFDFTLDYEKDPDAPPGNLSLVGPAMFTAFQEQLGLKLESTKAPLEVIVVDHAEQPSPN